MNNVSLCTISAPPTSVISCNFTWAWSVNYPECERDGVAMSGKAEAVAGAVVDRLMHLMNRRSITGSLSRNWNTHCRRPS